MSSEHAEIRAAIRQVCGDFPGRYWQDLEDRAAYPEDFVRALTDGGWLSTMIPARLKVPFRKSP